MKKKQLITALIMMFAVGAATGCKNSSKSSLEPEVVVGPSIKESTKSEELKAAVQAKVKLQDAVSDSEALASAIEASKVDRDEAEAVYNTESNLEVVKAALERVEVIDSEIESLEKQMQLSVRVVEARKRLMVKAMENLTEDEVSELGAVDTEAIASPEVEDVLAGVETRYEALQEIISTQRTRVNEITEQITVKSDRLEELDGESLRSTVEAEKLEVEIESLERAKNAAEGQIKLMGLVKDSMSFELTRAL